MEGEVKTSWLDVRAESDTEGTSLRNDGALFILPVWRFLLLRPEWRGTRLAARDSVEQNCPIWQPRRWSGPSRPASPRLDATMDNPG